MKLLYITSIFLLAITNCSVLAQKTYSSLPKDIDKSSRYLFYLHGRIIEEQGVHAVSAEYGTYEYLAIVDTLSRKGFTVISEARVKNTDENFYAEKVANQIESLIKKEVPAQNIYVIGASKGAYITLLVSKKVKNKFINYTVMGVCSIEEANYWEHDKATPCGNFLSIYEASDTFGGSCAFLLGKGNCISGFQEVKLTMNNKHGFLYKPYAEWINPLVEWAFKK